MIYDTKENLFQYKGISEALDRAIDYLLHTDFTVMDAAKYPVDGDRVFTLVQTPDTRPKDDARWESHQNYIDIQYLIEGEEIIGFQKTDSMTVSVPYSAEKDVAFYEDNGGGSFTRLFPGAFTIYFPSDAHMPLISPSAPLRIKKAVIKVKG